MARIVVPIVGEAHRGAVSGECPQFLDEPVVQLLGPLAREESNRQVLRNHNSHCPCSIAKATEFSFHEFSLSQHPQDTGLSFEIRRGWRQAPYRRCPSQTSASDSHREGSPPGGKASVADKVLAVEEHAGFGAAKGWSARGAALAPQQSQPCNHIVEVVLDP